ncbi:heat shock protein HslJ [Natronospira proteinivora]|uniref:Heat shock protein HslJ n=1 Tax=Natronospira proteinivora TaxID=1807133 RepID=A0ABT1GA85_9GAMM|nr:hypothetical protein [Natronospira proteinivora]MCP1727962.1 heat shock protein HslJ [Natronospira proteinivora]
MFKQTTTVAVAALILAACAGPEQAPEDRIPDWVADPQSEVSDGLAATNCVPASDSFSIDRSEAIALTRQMLAAQIEVGVEAMDETYQQQTRTSEGETVSGSTFQSVSRQLTDQTLTGVRVNQAGYETINEQRQLCTMLVMGESDMRGLFDDIIETSNRPMADQDEAVLWEQFRHTQAREEMDSALERRRGN